MEKFSLPSVSRQHLALARESSAGRSTDTVVGGSRRRLRQSVMTLVAGCRLPEHDFPGEATIQVLSGSIQLETAQETEQAGSGDLLVIPPERHSLVALEDAAVLLTVVK
ncbi:quercetin dioxygenase-like cupin family protein [Stackebrandtia endophytica]|uniref:Quercetin dioxygenase-like cupin family protein n=1 Tax=Stackebrandtia endophytica TaxID=1496996 RepID=A0A543APZ5_9ACTN|nr:cupin domain-containing protein [Stackebrandtia endophytica]TQL74619.1 quercetin dioxygenase-like cupin family protein [Stackebrandtia endophytica]